MRVFWKFIIVLVLAFAGLCSESGNQNTNLSEDQGDVATLQNGRNTLKGVNVRSKRDTADEETSASLWEWLTGQDKPTQCVMVSVGGVIGGGALMGAFVGAGIGSVFTGAGAIVGALIGGVVGIFSGVSVGHRAGAAACDSGCGTGPSHSNCYPYNN
ncbi:uncharacterized protein LOC131692897 [Topomyia yanbarensis]|uniref:uncharacterized protein LOC131692897 n=1 Tax=Topomyia yanbarensis TaxID=2498891 RepID=UPI00273C7A1B|nr:uncharacterized protein LOC131692897 [Topomyia yanbarensis]